MISRSESEMLAYGRKLGKAFLDNFSNDQKSVVIELIGDVGAGKTTLTRGIAEGLGIDGAVTSPSFTISKSYSFPGGMLVHYDFYRLSDPGLMAEDLADAISNKNTVVIIEWGESVANILPKNHQVYKITLNNDGSRTIEKIQEEK